MSEPGFHRQFNDMFQISSDVLPSDKFDEMKLRDISKDTVKQLVLRSSMNETDGRSTESDPSP